MSRPQEIHQALVQRISEFTPFEKPALAEDYHGSTHVLYEVPNPVKHQWVKELKKVYADLSIAEFTELLDLLYTGESYEEKTLAGNFLAAYPKLRKEVLLEKLWTWLEHLEGWAEVDTTCQNVFTAAEMLEKWSEWEDFLQRLNHSANINLQRASLVFLTMPVQKSADGKLRTLAFTLMENVRHEKDKRITKAISWLLRSLVKEHREDVVQFIEKNREELPKIAVRETERVLEFGKKNVKVGKSN